jgi:ferritin-like metal-binding protein YciE
VGVLLWVLSSRALRGYLHVFSSYSKTYGSLGAVIILMLWFYITGLAFLVGGEINSTLEHAAAERGHPEAKAEGQKAAWCAEDSSGVQATDATALASEPRQFARYGGNMPDKGLKELYIDELKDLYNAENQLVKALPKMAKAASSDKLRQGFEQHLEQTKGHVQRLEKIFQSLGESPKGKKCKGMEGLIEEGSEAMEEDYEGAVLDAALIGAAQRVEHYEMAGYGTVRSMAETLGQADHASLLEKTLEEEKETDEKLTELAGQINSEATETGEEQEEPTKQNKTKSKRVA